MRLAHPMTVLVAFLTVACQPIADPAAPEVSTADFSIHAGTRTSVYPGLDGSFGPVVLASCEQGFDLLYEQTGTVTLVETVDPEGGATRLQFVWNVTLTVTNSVSGFSLSGPSHGPDHTTFDSDGTSTLIQLGMIGSLRLGNGAPLTIDAGRIEFLIDENGASIVSMSGPHPHHEDFPDRPVLCALLS